MSGIRKTWLVNTLLALGGLAAAALLSEVALRLVYPPGLARHVQPCIYDTDDELGYVYRPNASGWISRTGEMHNLVKTNSMGFHDIEPVPGDRGGLRIAVLGDSTTAALEVPVEQGWTRVLEEELRCRGRAGARVFNMGLGGTGPDVQLALLKRHLTGVRPDLVILAFFWNDIKDVSRDKLYKGCYRGYVLNYFNEEQRSLMIAALDERAPGPLVSWLFEHSLVFRGLCAPIGRLDLLRRNVLSPTDLGVDIGTGRPGKPRPRARLRTSLNGFLNLSRKHGFRFVIMPLPGKGGVGVSGRRLRAFTRPETLASFEVLDLAPALESLAREEGLEYRDLFWTTDAHYNVTGNRVIGRAAAVVLTERGITPPPK